MTLIDRMNKNYEKRKRTGIAPYPPPLIPIVPLVGKFSNGPNVFPLSLLTLSIGTSFPFIVSHQVTNTLFPHIPISALSELTVELLRFILARLE
jgi:hypothetical protein